MRLEPTVEAGANVPNLLCFIIKPESKAVKGSYMATPVDSLLIPLGLEPYLLKVTKDNLISYRFRSQKSVSQKVIAEPNIYKYKTVWCKHDIKTQSCYWVLADFI